MDIYRICGLGKTLTETINEVLKDPTEDLVNKIWKLYDQCLEEEMQRLKDQDAMISVTNQTTLSASQPAGESFHPQHCD